MPKQLTTALKRGFDAALVNGGLTWRLAQHWQLPARSAI
jgi:hypothetical protein